MGLVSSRSLGRRRACSVCGAANHECGGPTKHQPVDEIREKGATMPETNVYEVEVRGTKTRLRLTPEEAENYPGAKQVKDATAAAKKRHAQAQAEALEQATVSTDTPSARTKKRAARTKKAKAARGETAPADADDSGDQGA